MTLELDYIIKLILEGDEGLKKTFADVKEVQDALAAAQAKQTRSLAELNAEEERGTVKLQTLKAEVKLAVAQTGLWSDETRRARENLAAFAPEIADTTVKWTQYGQKLSEIQALQRDIKSATAMYGKESSEVKVLTQELTTLAPHLEDVKTKQITLRDELQRTGRGFASSLFGFSLLAGGWVALGHEVGNIIGYAIRQSDMLRDKISEISGLAPELDTSKLFQQFNDMEARSGVMAERLVDDFIKVEEHLGNEGVNAAEANAEAIGRWAEAMHQSHDKATEAVLATTDAYELSGKEIPRVLDILTVAIQNAHGAGRQLIAMWPEMVGAGSQAGLSLDQIASSMVSLTQHGGNVAENFRAIKSVWQQMGIERVQQGFHDIGVDIKDNIGVTRSWDDILSDLSTKLRGYSDAAKDATLGKIIPDRDARQSLKILLEDYERLPASYDKAQQAGNAYWDSQQGRLEKAKAGVDSWLNSMGSIINIPQHLAGLTLVWDGLTNKQTETKSALDEYIDAMNRNDSITQSMMGTLDREDRTLKQVGESFRQGSAEANSFASVMEGLQASVMQSMDGAGVAANDMAAQSDQALKEYQDAVNETKIVVNGVTIEVSDNWDAHSERVENAKQKVVTAIKDLEAAHTDFQEKAKNSTGVVATFWQTMATIVENAAARARAAMSAILRASRFADQTVSHASSERAEDPRTRDYTTPTRPNDEWAKYYQEQANKDYLKATAPWLLEKPARGKGGGGSNAADNIEDAKRQLQQELLLEDAHNKVKAAQDALDEAQNRWNDTINETEKSIKGLQQAEYEQVTGHAAPLRQALEGAQKALEDFSHASERDIHTLDIRLHELDESLKQLNRSAAAALKPLEEGAEAASRAITMHQRYVRDTGNEYTKQLHDVNEQLYQLDQQQKPYNDELEAQQRTLQQISDLYDSQIIPLQTELNSLKERERQMDAADRLHDEAVEIDNIAARMAGATDAERRQLQFQLDKARQRHALHEREEALEARINKLEADKEGALRAQEERIRATQKEIEVIEARRKVVEEEQAAIQHRQQEFEYEQSQRALELTHQQEAAQDALEAEQRLWDARKTAAEEYRLKLQDVRDAQAYNDQETARTLGEAVYNAQQTYDQWKTVFDNTIADLNQLKEKQQEAAKAEIDPLKDAKDAAVAYEKNLRDSFQHSEKIDRLMDTIQQNTKKAADAAKPFGDDTERVKAAAEKLGVSMEEAAKALGVKLPEISKGADGAKTSFDNAKTSVDTFVKDGLTPLKLESDRTNPGSTAQLVFAMWNPEADDGFKKSHNTSLHDAGNAMVIFHDGAHRLWRSLIADAGQYLTLLQRIGNYSPGGSNSTSGDNQELTTGGGGNWWTPIVPKTKTRSLPGGGDVNLNVTVNAKGMSTKEDIQWATRRALDQAMQEYYTYTGRPRS